MVAHDKLRRPNRDRQLVSVYIARSGLAVIDQLAADAGVTRSEMIRSLLGEAAKNRVRKLGYTTAEDYLRRNP
jgi:hypothetical protein